MSKEILIIQLDEHGEATDSFWQDTTTSTTVAVAEHNPDREIEGPVEFAIAGLTIAVLAGLTIAAATKN